MGDLEERETISSRVPACCEVSDASPNHRGSRAAVTDTDSYRKQRD
jgi:hypothetical protein